MKRAIFYIFPFLLCATGASAQGIRVSPTGVNVNSQGATTAFLTFGGLNNQTPAEACWCGEITSAAPDIGLKCDPATLFGCLPARYNLSTPSGNRALTDIMSIPPSVSRRAYQDAQRGAESRFFYVRRFVSTVGGPDEYVAVTCRLTGGGARAPFALTDVRLAFAADKPVLFATQGEKPPSLTAEISYTGTGRLKGRWEVVKPGDELPAARDLVTEATLPIEERALQRRYTQLSRFNIFLPPTGKYILQGPDVSRLPTAVEGMYMIILRVEASDDREGDSDLADVGAGGGVVHSGAVAGFLLPVLRYFVGGGADLGDLPSGTMALLLPVENAVITSGKPLDFSWTETEGVGFYRLEVEDARARPVMSALLRPGVGVYRAPSWLRERVGDGIIRWRVVALDHSGVGLGSTAWRALRFE